MPRIPINIHWHYSSLVTETQEWAFGLFCYKDDKPKCIEIACCKVGTTGLLSVIAHEFVHYLQFVHGRDMNDLQVENDAEYYGKCLFGLWLLRGKDCSYVKAWEEAKGEV